MKKLSLLFIFFLAVTVVKAQDRSDDRNAFAISPAFELGLPNQSVYSVGLGGSLKVEAPVIKHFSITATGGISSFHYKDGLSEALGRSLGSNTFVPLKGGVKFYGGPGFYLEAEAGNVFQTTNDKRSLFAYAIGPGFVVPVHGGKSGVDVGFRYERWSQGELRQTALRIGYRFGW
ncbi:hypothetical protein MUY27_03590 [Mucilaginibacter sp. RS28]|uniref:Outer membrane protein beta-barrel domain-containing protein n=1 Tax=Mucilaginibacter straminoryzae TaxID=2932774 RepID=A0A9X1X1A2_9SPHI|nr:hypothetical protein [Mucilaginibacter straminoryzae]MCJ8208776.1 hypothetical protein [Mucilaginibacter straminoryzae]